jgi:tetratricopeptide (TPR) repeat protein
MKPLGSITMYYPFVEPAEQKIMELLTKESRHYQDFAQRLGNHVCYEDATYRLAHLASVHAWELRDSSIAQQVYSKHGQHPLVKPWFYLIRERSDRLANAAKIEDAIRQAIASSPDYWELMNIYLLGAYSGIHTPLGPDYLDKASELIEVRSSELDCFIAYVCHIRGRIKLYEGEISTSPATSSINEMIKVLEQGLESASKFNNTYQTCWLLRWLAMATNNYNPRRALEYLEPAYKIAQSLGSPFHIDAVLKDMGTATTVLGEYDLALQFHNEGHKIRQTQEGPGLRHALLTARVLCDINAGPDMLKEALDWGEWALEWHHNVGSEGDTYTLLILARALILLDRLDEAVERIDSARAMALTSGQEDEIGWYYYVSGLHELASGELETAIQTLLTSLESAERLNFWVLKNRCFLAIAEAEIQLTPPTAAQQDSTKWLTILERHADDNNLPGIQMQCAILKAKLYAKLGMHEEAKGVLEAALSRHDSLGLRSLHIMMKNQIQELNRVVLSKS